VAAGFVRFEPPRCALRRRVRERGAVSRASQELPRVLRELHATLKPRGVLFSSNPHGGNEEGWSRGRYGAYHDLQAWRRFMTAVGFAELTHYYRARRPAARAAALARERVGALR